MYELKHSAKGTHWTKKDHKYIRKEGDKYYYKDSKNSNTSKEETDKDYPLADLSDEEIEAQAAEKAKQSLAEEQIAWRLSPEKYEMRKMQYQIEMNANRNIQKKEKQAKEEAKKKEREKAMKAFGDTFKAISKVNDSLKSNKAVRAAKSVAKDYAQTASKKKQEATETKKTYQVSEKKKKKLQKKYGDLIEKYKDVDFSKIRYQTLQTAKKELNSDSEKVSKGTLNSGKSVKSAKSIMEESYSKVKEQKIKKDTYKAPTYAELLAAYLNQKR